jgi:cytochrome c-type biogenesis protein CcmE
VTGDAYARGGMRFQLKDIGSHSANRVPVVYRGSVPDLFKTGRHVVVEGTLRNGVFVAKPGSLVTKCPSKYAPAKSSNT